MRRLLLLALMAAAGAACAGPAKAQAWPDYQIIEWQPRNAAQLATLKRIGVTAAAAIADRDGTGTPLDGADGAAAPGRAALVRREHRHRLLCANTIAGRRASR